jgi:hypothetical protein
MDAADIEQQRRDNAEELQRNHPRWLVLYGGCTHQYVAFPRFAVNVTFTHARYLTDTRGRAGGEDYDVTPAREFVSRLLDQGVVKLF